MRAANSNRSRVLLRENQKIECACIAVELTSKKFGSIPTEILTLDCRLVASDSYGKYLDGGLAC